VGASFGEQEDAQGYFQVLRQVVVGRGVRMSVETVEQVNELAKLRLTE
jgi:hypothetical protein